MANEKSITFFNDGLKLSGIISYPDGGDQVPGIVMCPGFVGRKDWFLPAISEQLVKAGYATLRFDYRGFGESEGTKGRVFPLEHVADTRAALSFLSNDKRVDPSRLGIFGISFGGATAAFTAAVDSRVRCTVCLVAYGNGERWQRSLRPYWGWRKLLERLQHDRIKRATEGNSEMVHRNEVVVPDPRTEKLISETPEVDFNVTLELAEKIIEFKPADIVDQISPRAIFFIHSGADDLVPPDELQLMFERAGSPKRLEVIPGASHYDIYKGKIFERVMSYS